MPKSTAERLTLESLNTKLDNLIFQEDERWKKIEPIIVMNNNKTVRDAFIRSAWNGLAALLTTLAAMGGIIYTIWYIWNHR